MARKGDLIVVNPQRVGGSVREGEIIEVIEADLRVQYRVRWNDGHESWFVPGAGGARIESLRNRKKAGSGGTEPKKSPAKASTARKSRAKEASAKTTTFKKSTAKVLNAKTAKKSSPSKSTVRRAAAKKGSRG